MKPNLSDLLVPDSNSATEIIRSVILKRLIQIDRSRLPSEQELKVEILYYLRTEAASNQKDRHNLQAHSTQILALT